MRTIKYRGKALDNGRWVYGYYWSNDIGNHFIKVTRDINGFCLYDVEVDPETVGEWSGKYEKLNKTGEELYEDDLVEVSTTGINYKSDIVRGVIKFIDGCYTVVFSEPVYDIQGFYRKNLYVKCFAINNAIKKIGTIHDQEAGKSTDGEGGER